MNWKLLIPFALILALQVQDICYAAEENVACPQVSIVSPTDGSLWIGTSSDGLLRIGRNGNVLHYCIASGHLKNDTIKSLVFDASGTLYILDGLGCLTRYTSVDGFSAVSSFESGVGALSESAGIPYIIKDSLLYSLSGELAEIVRTLPFSISSDSLTEIEYDAKPEVEESDPSMDAKNRALSPLLWIALGLCFGLGAGFLLFRGRRKEKLVESPVQNVTPLQRVEPVKIDVTPAVEKGPIPEETAPVMEKEDVSAPAGIEEALKASEFGQKVWNLVLSNLSNPGYGVEQVAADLDISRIHVNRKLKAQTGYSPSTVFKFIRMNHASKLLLEGKLTIADVARECGFASASYFSTAFKDYYKQSPSEFVAEKSHQSSGTLDLQ